MKQKQKQFLKKNETKSWFLEKINKIDKPLAKFINRKEDSLNL